MCWFMDKLFPEVQNYLKFCFLPMFAVLLSGLFSGVPKENNVATLAVILGSIFMSGYTIIAGISIWLHRNDLISTIKMSTGLKAHKLDSDLDRANEKGDESTQEPKR